MQQQKIKIVFWGTPIFAKIILDKLIKEKNIDTKAIVTTPDKLIGRKQILTQSPVKNLSKKIT